MERLRPYDSEFDTIEELNGIVQTLMSDLNSEVSQATGQPPEKMLKKEKEYLHQLPGKDILETYLTIPVIRKVSKESMIVYNKRKYSLPTHYIGKTVEIQEENEKICIYCDGLFIASHMLSQKPFNYKEEHLTEILRSDAMKGRDSGDIEETARRNMALYDSLGGE